MGFRQVFVARCPSEMDRLAPLWNQLLNQQSHTLFQQFSWNRLAAHIFSDRLTPYVVCVESESGAAIVPAAINNTTNRLELLGEALFDYRDVLHAGDLETLQRAWRELAACGKPMDVIALTESAAANRWGEFPLSPFAMAPLVDRSSLNESEFRMAHSRLGRQMRRLQKQGVTFCSFSGTHSAMVRRLY